MSATTLRGWCSAWLAVSLAGTGVNIAVGSPWWSTMLCGVGVGTCILVTISSWRDHGSRRVQATVHHPGPRSGPGPSSVAGGDTDRDAEGAGTGLAPIRAFKAAGLIYNPALGWRFIGYGDTQYGVEDVAHCADQGLYGFALNRERHDAPGTNCRCGFYGVASPERTKKTGAGASVLLEVELYGRVLEYQGGWRAEKMRVLSARLRGAALHHCTPCYVEQAAQSNDPMGYRFIPHTPAKYRLVGSGEAVCARHAVAQRRHFVEAPVDLDELRRDLPTDWSIDTNPAIGATP